MAIDTAEKRRSVAGVHRRYHAAPGVTPNATRDQEWRQEAGHIYSGIATASPGVNGVPVGGPLQAVPVASRNRLAPVASANVADPISSMNKADV